VRMNEQLQSEWLELEKLRRFQLDMVVSPGALCARQSCLSLLCECCVACSRPFHRPISARVIAVLSTASGARPCGCCGTHPAPPLCAARHAQSQLRTTPEHALAVGARPTE
jgi:hypothetical protein